MKLTSIARTKADLKADKERYSKCEPMSDKYAYGTRLSLGTDELEKLGLSVKGLKVGDTFKLEAVCEVNSANVDMGTTGTRQNLSLQLTKMALEKDDDLTSVIDKAIAEAGDDE